MYILDLPQVKLDDCTDMIETKCRIGLVFNFLPGLYWADLFVVAVYIMVEEANNGQLS